MPWLTRCFILLVTVAALGAGAACTRMGKPAPVIPTIPPLTTLEVNPKTGSDTTGNGTLDKPYKTLTKAIAVVANSTTPGLTIHLALGVYGTTSGEKFPIIIPTGLTIDGTTYGQGITRGSFINGSGNDAAFEKLVGAPSNTAFATVEVAAGAASVAINNVYVGTSHLPAGSAFYASLDAIGSASISHVTLGAGTSFGSHPNAAGMVLPSGDVTCIGCAILGSNYALLAFTVPGGVAPVVVLGGQPTQGMLGGKIGIATDGTPNVNASFQVFQSKEYGYQDAVKPLATPSGSYYLRGFVDFGNGPDGSSGGNSFIGSNVTSEISVTLSGAQVTAEGDYWNPNTQGTNAHGLYPKHFVFNKGTRGRNVTVADDADGAAVIVGPIPPPTPQPSTSPSSSPSPTSSPT